MLSRMSAMSLSVGLVASQAAAEPQDLTAAEIDTLLSGNTAVGDWSGTPYRQYFDPNGRTTYAPKGGRADVGRWRVNADTQAYESYWERSGWSSYGVAREGDVWFWVQSSGTLQAFVVEPGNRLTD